MQRALSTSEERRSAVITSAIVVFSRAGYMGTPITAVAKHAKISPAYVFKLFPSKEELFIAALEKDFELIQAALADSIEKNARQTPAAVLHAMGGAYAELIVDRSLLMLQVHALSAVDVPEVGAALRRGLQGIVKFVKLQTGASDEAVQRFFAYGQLCHLITTLSLDGNQAAWAKTLTMGMRHG